jgi:hypothetical protein
MAEGGPFHVRDHGSEYLKRLRETGRGEMAQKFTLRQGAFGGVE